MDSELASAVPLAVDEALLLAQSLDRAQYTQTLTKTVFADQQVRHAWARVRGFLEGTGQILRFRLRIEPSAQRLHSLHWELLGDPEHGGSICRDQQIFFSRYVDSGTLARLSDPPAFDATRIVVVVANPTDLARYQLPEIDASSEIERATRAFEGAALSTLWRYETAVVPTRENLRAALNEGCQIVYLVCHGSFQYDRPLLWLERPDGTSLQVFGDDLVEDVRALAAERRPSLVVLASCQSAGSGSMAEPVLSALGPQLVAAGVGAVVGLRGNLPLVAADQLFTRLFTHLRSSGEIDRALSYARTDLGDDQAWWAPVLFQRLRDGQILRPSEAPSLINYSEALQLYQQQVLEAYKLHSFRGFNIEDSSLDKAPLDDIFVRLRLVRDEYETTPSARRSTQQRRRARDLFLEPQTIELDEALRRQLVIVGDPGSGKSTLLRWIAVTFAQGRQRELKRIGPLADAERIPILIELGRNNFEGLTLDWRELLPQLVTRQADFRAIPPAALSRAIDDGRCILLFDGLDEISDRELRGEIVKSLADFSRLAAPNRVIIGSRKAGVRDHKAVLQEQEFRFCEILPFNDTNIQDFFHYWYTRSYPNELELAVEKAEILYARLQQNEPTRRLAQNPLLCTLICIIWEREAALPERRVHLYDACCRILIDNWADEQRTLPGVPLLNKQIAEGGAELHLRLLVPLAYAIHEAGERDVSQALLLPSMAKALREENLCPDDESAMLEARAYLRALTFRSGLLQTSNDELYGFPHHTFQEYLAARHLATLPDQELFPIVVKRLYKSWWREIHLLLIGHLGRSERQRDNGVASEELDQRLYRAGLLINMILDLGRLPRQRLRLNLWQRAFAVGRASAGCIVPILILFTLVLVIFFFGEAIGDLVRYAIQILGTLLAPVVVQVRNGLAAINALALRLVLGSVCVLVVIIAFYLWSTREERELKSYDGLRMPAERAEARFMISVLQREYELVALAGREFDVITLKDEPRRRLSFASAWLLQRILESDICAKANEGLIGVACDLLLDEERNDLQNRITSPFQSRPYRIAFRLRILNEIGAINRRVLYTLLKIWRPSLVELEEELSYTEYVALRRRRQFFIEDYAGHGFPKTWLESPLSVADMLYGLLVRERKIWAIERQIYKSFGTLPRVAQVRDWLHKLYRNMRDNRLDQLLHVLIGFGIAAPAVYVAEIIQLLLEISNESIDTEYDFTTVTLAISALRYTPQPDVQVMNRLLDDLRALTKNTVDFVEIEGMITNVKARKERLALVGNGVELEKPELRVVLFDVPAQPTEDGLQALARALQDPHTAVTDMVYRTLATLPVPEPDLHNALRSMSDPHDAAGYYERIVYHRRFSYDTITFEGVLAAVINQETIPEIPSNILDTFGGGVLSEHQEDLIVQALTSGNAVPRDLALSILRQHGEPSPNLVTVLVEALNDRRWWVRESVLLSLATVRYPSAALIDAISARLSDPRIEVGDAAATTLSELCPRSGEALAALVDLAASGAPDRRLIAVKAFAQLSQAPGDVVAILTAKLDDSVPNVRAAAALSLARLGQRDEAIIMRLIRLLEERGPMQRGVRIAAAEALGRLGNHRRVLPALQKALDDPLPLVRVTAARSLANLKASGKGITEALVRLLKDHDESVRGAALATLGRFGEKDLSAVEALISIVNNKGASFRGAALEALGRLSESSGSDARLRLRLFEVLCSRLQDPEVAFDAASSLRNFTQDITQEPLLRRIIYIYILKLRPKYRFNESDLIAFLRKILEDRPLPIEEYNPERMLNTRLKRK